MKKREKIQILTDAGFIFMRDTRHGSFFKDDYGNMILVPDQHKGSCPRADKNWITALKRIKKQREEQCATK